MYQRVLNIPGKLEVVTSFACSFILRIFSNCTLFFKTPCRLFFQQLPKGLMQHYDLVSPQTGKFVKRSRLRHFERNAGSDVHIWANVPQTRILAKRKFEMLLCNSESAPKGHHSLTKRVTRGEERKYSKPMKCNTKNSCRTCLRGLDALNLHA